LKIFEEHIRTRLLTRDHHGPQSLFVVKRAFIIKIGKQEKSLNLVNGVAESDPACLVHQQSQEMWPETRAN